MTDEARTRNQTVAAIVKGVAIKTALLVAIGTVAFLGYTFIFGADRRWWYVPLSALAGGALGLLNFRWLAVAVERIYLRQGATPGLSNIAAAIISVRKLSLIFVVLFVVIKWQLLHVFGMIAGLSFSFLAIVWEGARLSRQNLINND
jgi:ATP synthase I chain